MECPPAIAEIILKIMDHGIMLARSAGWGGDAARAAIEADHIHNLPDLLRHYLPDKLWYYWNAERPAYIARVAESGNATEGFDEIWQRLAVHIADQPEPNVFKQAKVTHAH